MITQPELCTTCRQQFNTKQNPYLWCQTCGCHKIYCSHECIHKHFKESSCFSAIDGIMKPIDKDKNGNS